MEIKVNALELSKRLEQVAKVVANKNVMQILADVMIEIRSGIMVLTASDSEIWLSLKCPIVSSEQDVKFCVNAKDLLELTKNLGDKDVTISIEESESKIVCDYGNGNFEMPYDSANEFPVSGMMNENKASVIVGCNNVLKAIKLTDFAVGNNELFPIQGGLHFDFSSGNMTVSATNQHKIAVFSDKSAMCDIKGSNTTSFTIPQKSALILVSILGLSEGDVKISFDNNSISVNNTNFKLTSRLLEGKFPNCKAVISQERPIVVTIDKSSILQALKRVIPMSNAISELVQFFFDSGQVTLMADNKEYGKSASETVKCDCDANLKIGFKGGDLVEIIKNIDDDNVVIELSDSARGGVFYALSTYSRDEYVSVLSSSLIM